MASLWKRSNSPYFVACFTTVEGRQLKRSTKTSDRRLALKLAHEFETAARQKRTARQVRKVIESLHRDLTGEDLPSKTVEEYIADWLARKKPSTSHSTFLAYSGATKKLLAVLGGKAGQELSVITHSDLDGFRQNTFLNQHPTTVNHTIKIIRMIFKAAHEDGLIPENPAERLATVKKPPRAERRPFKLEELRSVLSRADAEWQSLILFGLYTGQRLGDLARLTWANIDMKRATLALTTAKTGKRMSLPLATPLKRHLESRLDEQGERTPLHPRAFATVTNTKHASTLSRQFAELLAAAGLRSPVSHSAVLKGRSSRRISSELSFHCLRHTASTLLREAGVPDAVVMEYIGHEDPQMSQHYTHVGAEALASAAARLPDLCP